MSKITIHNPLKLNDWPIREFIIFVLSLQLSLSGLIVLATLNVEIPVLRQLIGFIFLSFIPGFLILRILGLHNLDTTNSLLFSVGLSLSFLMLVGLFINSLYPIIGIPKPLSLTSLLITINIFIFIMLILSYFRDIKFTSSSAKANLSTYINIYTLSLSLLPFLAIFGTYSVNFYNNNILLMVLLPAIATILVIVIFNKLPQKLYPFTIWIISISLLFHTSLISNYLLSWDPFVELYVINQVITNSYWDVKLEINQNSILSIVILAPIYTKFLSLDPTWTLKIIYPFFFSLLPVCLYQVYHQLFKEKNFCDKVSFLSSFLYMSFFSFCLTLERIYRQQIAMLFVGLTLLILLDKKTSSVSKTFVTMCFLFSIVVSHYGTSYLFMFIMISLGFFSLFDRILTKHMFNEKHNIMITIAFFVILNLAWFIYTSSSSVFISNVSLFEGIKERFAKSFLQSSQTYQIIINQPIDYVQQIQRVCTYIVNILIGIGILSTIFRRELNFDRRFYSMAVVSFLIFMGTVFTPYFSFGITRIYQILLIFLAPFCYLGLESLFLFIRKTKLFKSNSEILLKYLAALLSIFLLLNVGFIQEILHTSKTINYAISQNTIEMSGDITRRAELYEILNTKDEDYVAVNWLKDHVKDMKSRVYMDCIAESPLCGYGMMGPSLRANYMFELFKEPSPSELLPLSQTRSLFIGEKLYLKDEKSYESSRPLIYLGYANIRGGVVKYRQPYASVWAKEIYYPIEAIKKSLKKFDKIYTNGGAEVWQI